MFADIQRQAGGFFTAACGKYPKHRFHALIDGALLQQSIDEDFKRAWHAMPSYSLFPASTSETAKACGPLLIDVTSLSWESMPSMLDITQELWIGSVMVSWLSARDLARALSPFIDVRLADRSNMLMRFQDPRVFPSWLEHLEPPYQDYLAAQCGAWMFIDPTWHLKLVEFAETEHAATPDFPMNLSPAAQSALELDCFPHTVIARFAKEDRAALEQIPTAERYEFFKNQIARATAHGFETLADIEIYCSLAIAFGKLFDEQPAFQSVLESVAAGVNLARAVANVGMERVKQESALT